MPSKSVAHRKTQKKAQRNAAHAATRRTGVTFAEALRVGKKGK